MQRAQYVFNASARQFPRAAAELGSGSVVKGWRHRGEHIPVVAADGLAEIAERLAVTDRNIADPPRPGRQRVRLCHLRTDLRQRGGLHGVQRGVEAAVLRLGNEKVGYAVMARNEVDQRGRLRRHHWLDMMPSPP